MIIIIHFENEQITIFQSELFKTTSTVIQTDDCIIIVDPNWLPTEVSTIKKHVDKIKGTRPLYLLFTHSDFDHIIGYGAFPEATVIASSTFDERSDKADILEDINSFDDMYYIDRNYPITYPEVDITITEDQQRLSIGKTSITFYLAKGHTNDGIYAIIEPLGIWIAGDYLSDVEFPFIYDSSEAYLTSLAKTATILDGHDIQLLIPGHGTYTKDIVEIKRRTTESVEYIKTLKKTIRTQTNSSHLIDKYTYPKSMTDAHEANITLIKNEVNKSL